MDIANFFFLMFSAFTIACSLMVVFSKNPIYSILYLILTMFSLSGHYILLNAQFISVINIIVYAGAIMVLFLFVLMLLNLKTETEPNAYNKWGLLATATGMAIFFTLAILYGISIAENSSSFTPVQEGFGYVKPLGRMLFTKYVFPFEIASILFLSAIVGVVFIGEKKKIKTA